MLKEGAYKEARWWSPSGDTNVRCGLCMFRCRVSEGKFGQCGVRKNIGGKLYSFTYNRIVSRNVDPIEKKPLHHFLPGTSSYSIATAGCNFRCLHCQNADISQLDARSGDLPGYAISPEGMVREALETRCRSISYTYTEPTIFVELALDTAALAKEKGLKNAFVTNGYQTPEFIKEMSSLIDAANVDLKSGEDEFYKKVCGARLEPVMKAISLMHEAGMWVEVTTLLIPGLNDSDEQLQKVARFIANTGKEIPWHITQFYPTHRMTDRPPTPASSVLRGREIGIAEGLKFVYSSAGEGQDTFCPKCKALLIERHRFFLAKNRLKDGRCPDCGNLIGGIWK